MINQRECHINVYAYVIGFLIFSIIPAFYVWNSVFHPLFTGMAGLLALLDIVKTHQKKWGIGSYFFLFITFIYVIISKKNFLGSLQVLSIVPFAFVRKEFILQVYQAFRKIFALFMIIAIPSYFMVVWIGVNLPGIEIETLNTLKLGSYTFHPFVLVYTEVITSPRFIGFFDEAGVVGTLSAIFLIMENFNLKNKLNIVILLAGVLSMSLFFFFIIGAYLVYTGSNRTRIIAVVIVLLLLVLFYDNEIIYDTLFKRLTFEDGGIVGMNREHGDFTSFYEKFRHTPEYWTGLGAGSGAKLNEGGSSYKQMIVNYGVIYFVLYMLSYYLLAIRNIKSLKAVVVYSLILLGTMFQRPFAEEPATIFLMITAGIIIPKTYYINKNNIYE